VSTERSFFQVMEEFGFFQHIYEGLPADFTAVFEIARVLEDEDSDLRQKLEPALSLRSMNPTALKGEIEDFHVYVSTGEEYEAEMIQSHRDVARIYPHQFILPDELFMRRLAERTLLMPIAKAPRILPIEALSNDFSYDSKKQKVYVLFDTSASMQAHHRIHVAKAILYYFLKRNQSELGFISLRTFDDHVGEVHTAVDRDSYDALMRYVLRLSHLGHGTVLQKALMDALDDIQTRDYFAGAEILVITDGAVVLNEALIRAKMDQNIWINTVKIGHAQIHASEKDIDAYINSHARGADKILDDLLKQHDEASYALRSAHARDRQMALQSTLSNLEQAISERKQVFRDRYGHELKHLSNVFIEIDDLHENALFGASEEVIADLEELASQLEEDAKSYITPELTKKMAVLHDHLQFLMKYEKDPALMERLQKMDKRLKDLLLQVLGEKPDGESGTSISQSVMTMPLDEEDRRDLEFLLMSGAQQGANAIAYLLRWLWRKTFGRLLLWLNR
jgi:hypothetical protein